MKIHIKHFECVYVISVCVCVCVCVYLCVCVSVDQWSYEPFQGGSGVAVLEPSVVN